MSYNALDNPQTARDLLTQLRLEAADINASLEYEHATSWCDDCPARAEYWTPQSYSDIEFGPRFAPSCCKSDGQWEEDHLSDNILLNKIAALEVALTEYLDQFGEDSP